MNTTTQLADVVIPEEFTKYMSENTMAGSPLVQTGIIQRNPLIESSLKSGSDMFTVPYWLDINDSEWELANDDPNDKLPTTGIAAKSLTARKSYNTKGFSAMSLASELAGSSAIDRIQERINAYVSRQAERKLVAVLNGVYSSNKAATGDMINDVSKVDKESFAYQGVNGLAIPDCCLNIKTLTDTVATLGMKQGDIKGILVHRNIFNEIIKLRQTKLIPIGDGSHSLRTFEDYAIAYSDDLPFDEATGVYTSVLFGTGAISAGFGEPTNAPGTELIWDGKSGRGFGENSLIIRQVSSFVPAGWSWAETAVAGVSPTLAELADGQNWVRMYERDNCPMAFLTHLSYEKATAPAPKAKKSAK